MDRDVVLTLTFPEWSFLNDDEVKELLRIFVSIAEFSGCEVVGTIHYEEIDDEPEAEA